MMEQRSNEWFRARLGKITGSNVADLMVKGRSKDDVFGKTAITYINKVAFERMLDKDIVNNDAEFEFYRDQTEVTSKQMRWGVENEDVARCKYQEKRLLPVAEASSVVHPQYPFFAASPDGIVAGEGVLEIKCVGAGNFVSYLGITDADSLKKTEPKYYWQMMAEMACTGCDWGDFVVYNPFVTRPLHIARINRNDDDVMLMLERVVLAEQEIRKIVDNYNQ